jgi:hypothetical protein
MLVNKSRSAFDEEDRMTKFGCETEEAGEDMMED